jgi:hypothetical protein
LSKPSGSSVYRKKKLKVQAVLTDSGREYCGTGVYQYEVYLALDDIQHRGTKVRRPQKKWGARL